MSFHELVRKRQSIRDYDPNRPVDKATLQRILEAGRLAPSAANRQPWRFLVVSSKEMLEKVRPCYQGAWFQEAPHILIVVGDRTKAWTRKYDGYNSLETDLAIAMDHMILAAEYEGVGTCWIAAFDPDILRGALRLKPEEQVFCITPLGYPKEGFHKSSSKPRKPMEQIAEFL